MKLLFVFFHMLFVFWSCMSVETKNNVVHADNSQGNIVGIMDTSLVDGFDYPIGNADGKGSYTSTQDGKTYDSWYIATQFTEQYSLGIHPGVDWNGSGGGNTDFGQPVYVIGKGKVLEAKNFDVPWGKIVFIEHKYLENGKVKYCYSLYAHLNEIKVKKGDWIEKRMQVGTIGTGEGSYPAHLHCEIRKEAMKDYEVTYWPSSYSKTVDWVKENYEEPAGFIKEHRSLTCPVKEKAIIVVIKNKYKLYYYEKGTLIRTYEIALSQNPIGHKVKEGDLRLPEGEYYITGKAKGPFYGAYAAYLGDALLRISYPNIVDANNGFAKGFITQKEKEEIISANQQKLTPTKNTKLGGGIVIHGWRGDWDLKGDRDLTWGCVSMLNKDLKVFYDMVNVQTKIVIIP